MKLLLSLFPLAMSCLIFVGACATSSSATAPIGATTDPCMLVAQDATKGSAAVTKTLTACLATICLSIPSACKPTPVPVPPAPSAMGGSSSVPISTGGALGTGGTGTGGVSSVAFPLCNPAGMKLPSPAQIEQYRKTLRPRHKITEKAAPLQGMKITPIVDVMHASNDPFCGNQKSVGACVAFTALDWATTQPSALSFATQDLFNSAALDAYKWITNNDPYPGAWPAQDTGSDTLTGCKWLIKMGYAKTCTVMSGKVQVLAALQTGSIMSGMYWLANMLITDPCGRLTVSGIVEGGHDIELVGYDVKNDEVIQQNHWDNDFGVKSADGHGGYMRMKSSDLFGTVLDADFVQPLN